MVSMTTTSGRMTDSWFLKGQWDHLYDTHVRHINRYIDKLSQENPYGLHLPYLAPWHGASDTRVLALLSGASSVGQRATGNDIICTENTSDLSMQLRRLMKLSGINRQQLSPWFTNPWASPNSAGIPDSVQVSDSVQVPNQQWAPDEVLKGLLALMPNLQVVLCLGDEAAAMWRAVSADPEVSSRSIRGFFTYLPSQRLADAATIEHQESTWRDVAEYLRITPEPDGVAG